MKIIGVTGGVGAGKSTVLSILEADYSGEILMADEIGREVMEPDGICFRPVADMFGPEILDDTGKLNRAKIAEKVFQDERALADLNAVIHPAVRTEVERRLNEFKKNGKQLVLIESAILLEAGYKALCDEIWYVYADRETRISRLMADRGYSREKCLGIINSQMTDAELKKEADRIIDNGGSIEWTKEQIASFFRL